MAKFTSTAPLNIRWLGHDLSGPAGTVHRIPDSLQDEFAAAYAGIIPGLTWTDTDEVDSLVTLPIGQTDVTGLTAALAAKVDTTSLSAYAALAGAIFTGAVTSPAFVAKGRPSYDVKAFGAVGDGATDDTVAIIAAVASASVAGGEVYFPIGTYQTSAKIGVPSNVTLRGAGPRGSIIKVAHTGYGIALEASLGTAYSLSGNVAVGATTIAVGTNSSQFSAGQMVFIRDEGTALLAGHKRAEIQTLEAVSSGLLHLAGAALDIYTTANSGSVAGVTPVSGVSIRDLGVYNTIYGSSTTTPSNPLIFMDFARDCEVSGVRLYQNNGKGIELRNCLDIRISGVAIENLRDNEGLTIYGYGIQPTFATRNVTITNCTMRRCRHAFTTATSNTGQTPNYGVQRNIALAGCVASDCTHAAFDTHEDSQGVSYVGCVVQGTQNAGFQSRGYYETISGCAVRGARGAGIIIDTSSLGVTINGTLVVSTAATTAGTDGAGIFAGGNDQVVIANCLIANNEGHGIQFTGANLTGTIVSGNGIYSNTLDGINVNVNITGPIIGNRIVSSGRYGVRFESGVSGTTSNLLMGNIVSGSVSANYSNAGTVVPMNLGNMGAAGMTGFMQRTTVTTGSIAASSTSDVTVTWPVSFGDTSYTPTAVCVESTGNVEVRAIKSLANGTITVTVRNNDSGSARTGTIHAIAIHD